MPWPDRRLIEKLDLSCPIFLAPMAGAGGVDLALAVARAGGLGALPWALLSPNQIVEQANAFRSASERPLNLNFSATPRRTRRQRLRLDGVGRWRPSSASSI